MKRADSPCLGCRNRQIGCHGRCEPYQRYAAENKAANEARRAGHVILLSPEEWKKRKRRSQKRSEP